MTGKQLKEIVECSGVRPEVFAELMGITPQSLDLIYHSIDVQSSIIEKASRVLCIPISVMYGEKHQQFDIEQLNAK